MFFPLKIQNFTVFSIVNMIRIRCFGHAQNELVTEDIGNGKKKEIP